MAVITSVTLNADGTAAVNPGDVLIGDPAEHVADITGRLEGNGIADAASKAQAIVSSLEVVPVDAPVPAAPATEAPVAEDAGPEGGSDSTEDEVEPADPAATATAS